MYVTTRPIETQPTITSRLVDRDMAEPNLSEHAQTGFDEKVNIKARAAVAQIVDAALEYQPIAAAADRNAEK